MCRETFRVKFPNIFAATRTKGEMVRSLLLGETDIQERHVGLRTRMSQIERNEFQNLQAMLANQELIDEEDRKIWLDNKGEYNVKDTTMWLEERRIIQNNIGL